MGKVIDKAIVIATGQIIGACDRLRWNNAIPSWDEVEQILHQAIDRCLKVPFPLPVEVHDQYFETECELLPNGYPVLTTSKSEKNINLQDIADYVNNVANNG